MQIYPIPTRPKNLYEKVTLRIGFNFGLCPLCGNYTVFTKWTEALRETGVCTACGARNRQRQIAYLLSRIYAKDGRFRSISNTDLRIYNLESNGSLHKVLARNPNYVSSEFLGTGRSPGEIVGDLRHEDAHSLSFDDASLDLVISSDVWEHLPDPYTAHREVYRVLRKGGRHVFTVPFYQGQFLDEQRARLNSDHSIEHLLDPIYHNDPLNPEGVLVFNIFSIEMLCRLSRIGFYTRFHKLYSRLHGILGNNGIIFEAVKQ